MFGIKKLCVLGLALALSACVSSEPASRSMSGDALTLASRGTGSIPETGSVRVMAAQLARPVPRAWSPDRQR